MTASPSVRRRGTEETRTQAEPQAGAAQGKWTAATGLTAVNAAEQLICGSGAVATPAAAEGLALTGRRAARVLSADTALVPLDANANAAWVLHRTTADRGAPFGAFALVPATVQEAVDHCLIAQASARRLGRAGECAIESRLLGAPALYQPLSQEFAESLLEPGDEGSADTAAVLAGSFDRFAKATGRVAGPLVEHRTEDAEHVLIAVGAARQWADQLVYALRKEGVKLGLVGITLLDPFPATSLAKVLRDKRSVVVVEGTHPELLGEVDAAIRAIENGKQAVELGVLDAWQGDALAHLRTTLGVKSSGPADLPDAGAPGVLLGVAPAGARADQLLLDVASRVAPLANLTLWRPHGSAARAALLGLSKAPARADEVDVLFVAHPSLFDPDSLGQSLRQGGTLVVAAAVQSSAALWRQLSASQRELLRGRDISLHWYSPAAENRLEADSPEASWSALQGVVLAAAKTIFDKRLGLKLDAKVGVQSDLLEVVDTSADPSADLREHDFQPASELPVMPSGPEQEPDASWRMALRRFHVTGAGAAGSAALLPLAPASVSGLVAQDGVAPGYPLVALGDTVRSLADLVLDALEELGANGKPAKVVAENLELLKTLMLASAAEQPGAQPFRPALEAALKKFAESFRLSDAARQSLDAELAEVLAALPDDGVLIGLGEHTHVELYVRAVRADRTARVAKFEEELRRLSVGLGNLLRVEALSAGAGTAGSVAASLGGAEDLFDAEALAKNLPKQRGPSRLGAARKQRVERALGVIEAHLERLGGEPDLFVVHPGVLPDGTSLGRARVVRHPDGLSAAAGLFDGLAGQLAEVLRAVRVARLEIENDYDPAVHDAVFAELDWTAFTGDELLLVPPVMVLETAERIWRTSLHALSSLLRSGRPIHVLVNESVAHHESTGAEARVSSPAGLGYLLVAHHEAVVVQSTLAQPHHLADGFARMARSLRPSVCVVESRPALGPMPAWLRLTAAHEGRALPCFRYDPALGTSWAENFDIEGNPQAQSGWPRHSLDYLDASGNRSELALAFTFADAAALDLAYRRHFWLIPPEAWSDEQIELVDFLEQLNEAPPAKVPYVWVVDDASRLGRAVVTRELSYECRERARLWRILQELGGSDNEHARRAAEVAREQSTAEATAVRAELEAAHAEELERVRAEAASDAMDRLAKVLLDPEALLSAAPLGGVPAVAKAPRPAPKPEAPAEAEAAAAPAPAPVEEEDEGLSFDEPYIDTPLCTSCNECTNLNPKMFQYNADKQAFIADANAGTFAQLVTAAEKCPATCIHPGVPRKDDNTVTDELVQRAARFK